MTDEFCLTYETGGGALFEWQSCVAGGATAWDAIGDAVGNGAIAMGTTEQTMDWEFTTTAHDGLVFNLDNNGGTAGTDNGIVITNAVSTNTTGDLNTESLLLLQQLDTTVTGTTVVDNAITIDVAANGGMTDGIEITNSAGNLTNGLNLVDTAGGTFTTGIVFSGTFTNIFDIGGSTLTGTEVLRLDGKDAALVDTNDAVATAIIGTGALDAGSITSNFGAIDTGADNITTTGTVSGNDHDRSTAGALTLGNTNATSLSLCNSAGCDTVTIGTNTDADSISIGDTNDTVAIVGNSSSTMAGFGLSDCDTTGSKLLWDTTTSTFSCGTDRASITIAKTANEVINNVGTLQNDDVLTFAIAASDSYIFYANMLWVSGTTPDIQFAITAPASAACFMGVTDPQGSTSTVVTPCGTTSGLVAGTGTNEVVILSGTVVNSTTSGNVTIQWAQNTATATNTTVYQGSSLLAYKTTGADLAEIYYTRDATIGPGDVVEIDPAIPGGIRKSATPYGSNILGVVSTKPGLILSENDMTAAATIPVNLALAGRVPVRVSTEAGVVRAGDYLTASSKPGVAMKATHAGKVIGQALADAEYVGNVEGLVKVFVKETYWNGVIVPSIDPTQLPDVDQSLVEVSLANAEAAEAEIVDQEVVAGLEVTADEQVANAVTLEMVSTTVGDALTAGLTPINEKLLGLETSYAALSATVTDLTAQLTQLQQLATEPGAELTVLSLVDLLTTNLATNSLNVNGQATVIGGLSVDALSATGQMLQVLSDTTFIGRPYFNADTAGFAVIKAGAQEVTVRFIEPYAQQPIVNASVTLDDVTDDPATSFVDESLQNAELVQAYLSSSSPYVIYRKSQTGFVIRLAAPAVQDTSFSWTAWAVDGPLTAFSVPTTRVTVEPEQVEVPVFNQPSVEEIAPIIIAPDPVVIPDEPVDSVSIPDSDVPSEEILVIEDQVNLEVPDVVSEPEIPSPAPEPIPTTEVSVPAEPAPVPAAESGAGL